jgi:hypothetical protein
LQTTGPAFLVVAVPLQAVIQGRVCSSGCIWSGGTVPFLSAFWTTLLAPDLLPLAFVAEKLRKLLKFLQQVLMF